MEGFNSPYLIKKPRRMKIILIIFLFINPVDDLNRIAEINSLKKEAKEAYTSGDYEQAVLTYEKLVNEYGLGDENILLNLANSYYKKENHEKALELYASLYESSNTSISSSAFNQAGLIAHQQKKKEEAINYFKEALKANPSNEAARFNYIKLKKEIEEEQKKKDQENKQNKDEKNKDKKEQEKKEQDNKESGDKKEGEEGEEEKKEKPKNEGEKKEEGEEQEPPQPSTADKLEEMNMSEEKAQMILEAMKNNEIQYIQQNQKKPQSKADDGKPDW